MAREITQAIVDGILVGGVYALMAVGLTLIFGVLDIINIAQCVLVILGAYLSYSLFTKAGIDPFLGLLITIPAMFIAAAGPDQGAAFTKAVGAGNATGMMVPNGWYPSYNNAESQKMVSEYVQQYGGSASGVNADVAEAYAVGQVVQQAITANGSVDNAKIISYLHSGVTLQTVQGTVKFDSLGENSSAAAFVFQWQNNGSKYVQVLPTGGVSVPIIATKPAWAR